MHVLNEYSGYAQGDGPSAPAPDRANTIHGAWLEQACAFHLFDAVHHCGSTMASYTSCKAFRYLFSAALADSSIRATSTVMPSVP